MSLSIVKKQDFQSLIRDYTDGLSPDFEKYLLRCPELESQEELERFLELETEYVQALPLLSLQLMLPSTATAFTNRHPASQGLQWLKFLYLPEFIASQQHNVEVDDILWSTKEEIIQLALNPLLTEYWEQLNSMGWSENWGFDKYDVLYVAWLVFNPIHLHGERELSTPSLGKEEKDLSLSH